MFSGLMKMAGGNLPPPATAPEREEILAIRDPEERARRLLGMLVPLIAEPAFVLPTVLTPTGTEWRVVHLGGRCAHLSCQGAALIREGGQDTENVKVDYRLRRTLGTPQWFNLPAAPLYVLVWNSTTEPDGSRKCYALRVSPWIRTTCQAIAYTFGREAHGWYPKIET